MIILKYVEPTLELHEGVAIVGSSGTLKDNDYGGIIDTHDEVIRFNRAPTATYEGIVGSKTTLRVVNNHVFWNKPCKKTYTDQPKDFVKNLRKSRILCIAGKKSTLHAKDCYTHKSNEVYASEPSHIHKFKKMFKIGKCRSLSVGVATICICVASGIRPDVFGFDVDVTNASRTHYWESRPPPGPCHKINVEKQLIKQLAKSDKIKLYT